MTRIKGMQCKDIPDLPILEFLDNIKEEPKWGSMHCNSDGSPMWDNSVAHAMPSNAHPNLQRAKMRSLIERGLVDGCGCGCRGDFRLTDKGLAKLAKPVITFKISDDRAADIRSAIISYVVKSVTDTIGGNNDG